EDRRRGIAFQEEIGVHRMRLAVLDRARGGDERLPDDLAAEYPVPRRLDRDPAKDVLLDLFEIEGRQEICEGVGHMFFRGGRLRETLRPASSSERTAEG